MTYNYKAGGGGAAEGPEIITKMANKAIKAIQSHVEALHDAADDVESLVDGKKSGRAFSHDNAQALKDHASFLHDLADDHEAVVKHLKKIAATADDLAHNYTSSYADNLASNLQGSVPTYASPNAGVPASGQQEGSGKRSSSSYMPEDPVTRARKQIEAVTRAHQGIYDRQIDASRRELAIRTNW